MENNVQIRHENSQNSNQEIGWQTKSKHMKLASINITPGMQIPALGIHIFKSLINVLSVSCLYLTPPLQQTQSALMSICAGCGRDGTAPLRHIIKALNKTRLS